MSNDFHKVDRPMPEGIDTENILNLNEEDINTIDETLYEIDNELW